MSQMSDNELIQEIVRLLDMLIARWTAKQKEHFTFGKFYLLSFMHEVKAHLSQA